MRHPILFALLLAFLGAGAAHAEQRVGLSFDANGAQPSIRVAGFEQFSLYVVAHEFVRASHVEFGLRLSDPSWTILDRIVLLSGAQDGESAQADDWVLSLGDCVTKQRLLLVEYRIQYMHTPVAPSETIVCLSPIDGGATPFEDALGYRRCGGSWQTIKPSTEEWATLPSGCVIVNPSSPTNCAPTSVRFQAEPGSARPGATGRVDICQFTDTELAKSTPCGYAMQSFSVRVRWDTTVAQLIDVIPDPAAQGVQIEWTGVSGDIVVQGTAADREAVWGWPVLFSLQLQAGTQSATTPIHLSQLGAPGFDGEAAQLIAESSSFWVGTPRVETPAISLGALKARY